MTDSDSKISAIAALAENCGKAPSESLLQMWMQLLTHYTSDQVHAGVMLLLQQWQYKTFPPFAALKEAIDTNITTDFLLLETKKKHAIDALKEMTASYKRQIERDHNSAINALYAKKIPFSEIAKLRNDEIHAYNDRLSRLAQYQEQEVARIHSATTANSIMNCMKAIEEGEHE